MRQLENCLLIQSNLTRWKKNPIGKEPSLPKAGHTFPTMYRSGMYQKIGTYQAKLKVYIRNTWDWITVSLRKSDMDYIHRHCENRKTCAPALQKRGKKWFLNFPFEETVTLCNTKIQEQTILAVDLGINCAATVTVMQADGTILGRKFCHLNQEIDHLTHCINRIKKAQKNGNYKLPRLWAKVKGINAAIASKTARFILETAVQFQTDVIVFEYLERKGKIRGSKKQRIAMWRSQEVQSIVANKAHRLGMRISHVCAWGTSKFAYDGSGRVERGIYGNYSVCKFQNGKIYNCDLSASYNIGARYYIRELLKTVDESSRLELEAKVPEVSKRSTCTFSTLIRFHAVLLSA